ncbi:cadherin-like beta sandwich domain-containing protein [Clostridium beijerinckii]|uniref:Cell wall-binding protein n=1 Tax=Clostridium beijerinckii TaxID=1520 RepID=A0A7X9XNH4_CLOBE|nr:cadherin-like beta sandwich domain-containing protein [Clostridium beijerinckii]NMF04264.1 cell wall-binding protein [Clostridium beijerinckii]
MNKGIKHIICIGLALGISYAIESVDNLNNIGITKAYALSYSLDGLELSSGGSNINLYENENYTKELDDSKDLKKTYYAKLSSDDSKIKFTTNGFDEDNIRIFKSRTSKVYEATDEIPVLTGTTTFYIRLYNNYNEEKPTDCEKEYKVIVKRYTSEQEDAIKNDDQSEIYLQSLQLDYGDIPLSFDRKKCDYNVKVGYDVKSIPIKAEPEDGATTVKINNITVDENDGYKKIVNLDKGDNKIEISLSQSYGEKRVYTLNINRAESSPTITDVNTDSNTNSNSNSQISIDSTKETNKWVNVSGKWKYNDSFGNYIKSAWFYDNNYGKEYYFNNDGDMVIGWLNLNNTWYYLNSDGAMQIGWKQVYGNWYYLDYDGKMKTGWFKDADGRYYYLNKVSGAMAHDTSIDGYKLGSDGAWKK